MLFSGYPIERRPRPLKSYGDKPDALRRRAIRTDADIAEGVRYLRSLEPNFDSIARYLPPLPLRLSSPGFETLLRILVSQQLSVAAASSIWQRLNAEQSLSPEMIHETPASTLAAAGLSQAKIRYAKGIASMVLDGALPLDELEELDDEAAAGALTRAKGVGRWTAELYLLSGLARRDVFPAGDLALQEAVRILFGLPRRPLEQELRSRAGKWSPWRSVAARILWQFYRQEKKRAGVIGST